MTIGRRSQDDGSRARTSGRSVDATTARLLGCSLDALRLTYESEVVDLHLDTFIPPRLWGYDPLVRHRGGPLGRFFFRHGDRPRLLDGGRDGERWSITTNPFRGAAARWRAFRRNLYALRALIARSAGQLEEVRTAASYRAARPRGAHAGLLAIQGRK